MTGRLRLNELGFLDSQFPAAISPGKLAGQRDFVSDKEV